MKRCACCACNNQSCYVLERVHCSLCHTESALSGQSLQVTKYLTGIPTHVCNKEARRFVTTKSDPPRRLRCAA